MKNACTRSACLLLSITVLSGCSSLFGPEGYFRDRGDNYTRADVLPAMRVPEGVEQRSVDQLYVIPPIGEETEVPGGFEVPRPQSLSDNAFTDRVKIQKLSDKRWILVSASPAEVWPQVRGFLSRNNLEVVYTNASTGIIETGWLKFVNDDVTQSRYRLRIEQGIQPESTEIHVLHQGVDNAVANQGGVDWPTSSTSEEREDWMVDELAGVIASNTSGSQAASLMAQSIGFGSKVVLDTETVEPVLRINVDRVRALATLTHSLNQGGFDTWEEDGNRGIYYVSFDENYVAASEAEEPGFFARLFSSDKPEEKPGPPYPLAEVIDHLQLEDSEINRRIFPDLGNNSATMLHQVPGYLVIASGQARGVEVRIRNGYGQALSKQEAKHLLGIIRQNLI